MSSQPGRKIRMPGCERFTASKHRLDAPDNQGVKHGETGWVKSETLNQSIPEC